jgi:hypothetical protein
MEEVLDLVDHMCHLVYTGGRANDEKYRKEYMDEVNKIYDNDLRKMFIKMLGPEPKIASTI